MRLLYGLSSVMLSVESTKIYGQHGKLWQRDICAGSTPAGNKIIGDHSQISCDDSDDELIVVHQPRNVPVIKYHEVEGVSKREFYDSQEQLHLAECYTDFGLPAPEIQAKITLQNGTVLYEEFDISACLGQTSKNFLSFSTGNSMFDDFGEDFGNGNSNCRTDFDWLNPEETDYVQRSTGILFKVIDQNFDKARISCQNSYFLNGTDGKRATAESAEIEIRVYRPMKEVGLRVEQSEVDGEIVTLSCEAFGGYPENYEFSYELNGAWVDVKELLSGSIKLSMNDELICSGVWSVGDQEKVMRSDTFLSVYQQKPLRNNQAGSHGGGDFDLYGDGSELDNNLDENEKDFPDRDDSNKTTKMVIFGAVVVIIIAIVIIFVRIQGWIPGFGGSETSTEDTEAHGGADNDEQAKEPLNPVQTNVD